MFFVFFVNQTLNMVSNMRNSTAHLKMSLCWVYMPEEPFSGNTQIRNSDTGDDAE